MRIPEQFELDYYRKRYLDLKKKNDDELKSHFFHYGIAEGRAGNRLTNRDDFIALCIDNHKKILEIGPYASPLFKKNSASRIQEITYDYADYLDQDSLIDRAKFENLPYKNIPHIKYVLSEIELESINENYEAVISSHCIEHQPDLIRHLIQVEKLLSHKKGRYFLMIPDKRFCFDKPIAESPIASIIEAYENKVKKHSLKSLIEHRALTDHNDAAKHWSEKSHDQKKIDAKKIRLAIDEFNEKNNKYIDVHAWQFTPKSFEEIILLLNELKYINLIVEAIYPTRNGGNEFWAILKNN
jgi:hypothetical protein